LNSPECDQLLSFYPNVRVETDLDPELLNISGSPLHLSKSLMNLVSNAAEAMVTGGTIRIASMNRYVDRPIRGYDDVREGDYVLIEIQDTGMGIAPEDLNKIFEPFYTKKVMGRSGTGLGMAVVWGTIKDHNGYIDIHSSEGQGTTFKLYFPVTRQTLDVKLSPPALQDYAGQGESILVVDDIAEQRDISSEILTRLGYSVTAVASGEEAVAYMQHNPVDLVILDMIMDPGMDGLDTFKRMLNLDPQVKAIIASGFSETGRVRETLRLGAGPYIKKPFTMEKIGMAIKRKLRRSSDAG
jgi:CheY-like chemotaxis protein